MTVRFYKYQGAGNDFILIDNREKCFLWDNTLVRRLCHRHTGIGGDGLMLLENDDRYEFYMRYFNSDGGEVPMCGNGGRCITLFAHHLGIGGRIKTFNSMDGLHKAEIISTHGECARIAIRLIDVTEIKEIGNALFLNTGVPHYVEFTNRIDTVDVTAEGKEIRFRDYFRPYGGTNVNFVEVAERGKIKVRTYERGVEGETLACGTGVSAAAIATSYLFQPEQERFNIQAQGGELSVSFQRQGKTSYTNIRLEGPACRVFSGEIDYEPPCPRL